MASPGVGIPAWYGVRWHFLPEGYLSRRSVALYDPLIPRLYNLALERRIVHALTREFRGVGVREIIHPGCGPGRILAALAARLPAAKFTGIDLSPFMLERAHDRIGARSERVDLRHADATTTGLPPGRFDGAVLTHLLGHVPEDVSKRILTEAARVLRPGGVLVSIDHRWHSLPPLPAAMEAVRVRSLIGGLIVMTIAMRRPAWQTGGHANHQGPQ